MQGQGGQLVTDVAAVKRLERLLEILELEPKWATFIADWIDSDIQAGFPDGAEDPTYTGLTPPYRTANMPLTRASELLAIDGFGLDRYRKLEPFVTALPIGTPINLCTASPELLDSIIEGQREYTLARDNVMDTRKQRCFPSKNDFESRVTDPKQRQDLGQLVGQTSSYFRATIWVTIGTTQYTLYSLLYRSGNNGLVRPILRSHGTP
jgi:general secretion pathway protein K